MKQSPLGLAAGNPGFPKFSPVHPNIGFLPGLSHLGGTVGNDVAALVVIAASIIAVYGVFVFVTGSLSDSPRRVHKGLKIIGYTVIGVILLYAIAAFLNLGVSLGSGLGL